MPAPEQPSTEALSVSAVSARMADDVETEQDQDPILRPVRFIVPAVETSVPPSARGVPASIWAMATSAATALRKNGRFGDAAGFEERSAPPPASPQPFEPAPVAREGTERSFGLVRAVGTRYPSHRWNAEREEQEQARRARQRPPRPVRAAKTRGKKVRAWDGEDLGDT